MEGFYFICSNNSSSIGLSKLYSYINLLKNIAKEVVDWEKYYFLLLFLVNVLLEDDDCILNIASIISFTGTIFSKVSLVGIILAEEIGLLLPLLKVTMFFISVKEISVSFESFVAGSIFSFLEVYSTWLLIIGFLLCN